MNHNEINTFETPDGTRLAVCFCARDEDWAFDDWARREGWSVQEECDGGGVEVVCQDNRDDAYAYAKTILDGAIQDAETQLQHAREALERLQEEAANNE